jgi:anti-sigma B factor antagonist
MSEASINPATPLERTGDAVIARPQSKMVDEAELKALMQAIDQMAGNDAGVSLIVLDLARVAILPSLALGLLVQIANRCKARQQRLKLAGVQPQVRQVFSITRLDRVFDFVPSVEAALG